MSFQLMAWAAEQRTGSPTRKAVLMALANAANHHTGRCFPSVRRIATETEASERTVIRALGELADAGFIEKERRVREDGGNTTTSYTFPHLSPPTDTAAPPPTDTGAPQNLEVPEPGVRVVATAPTRTGPRTVNRKAVTSDELERAQRVLAAWNDLAEQELRSDDWLAKIIMRLREYPDATLGDHRLIIKTALDHPWWTGPATPSVVYGSGAQFERSVQAVRAQREAGARFDRLVSDAEARRAQRRAS